MCLAVMLACGGCSVFSGEREGLRLREEKLAKSVFAAAAWHADFDQVRALAAQQGKVILAYFTRSYAR